MGRLQIAIVAVGFVVVVGVLPLAIGEVDGQEVATPAVGPCGAKAEATTSVSPLASVTPTAEAPFDLVYLDLELAHSNRLMDVANVTAERAEHDALRSFTMDMATNLEDRARRLGVWRSLWFGERPTLTDAELLAAIERLGEANPGRGGIPGGFEALGMTGMADEACVAGTDDALFLDLLIEAVGADLLLARVAAEQGEQEELRFEARAIAERDQRWLDGLIALRTRWYGDGATPSASPVANLPDRF